MTMDAVLSGGRLWESMWRGLNEHVKSHKIACEGLREEVLQSQKASAAERMRFSEKKIIAMKSNDILPFLKANLNVFQNVLLTRLGVVLKREW